MSDGVSGICVIAAYLAIICLVDSIVYCRELWIIAAFGIAAVWLFAAAAIAEIHNKK